MSRVIRIIATVILAVAGMKVCDRYPESEWALYARIIIVMIAAVVITLDLLGAAGDKKKKDEDESEQE